MDKNKNESLFVIPAGTKPAVPGQCLSGIPGSPADPVFLDLTWNRCAMATVALVSGRAVTTLSKQAFKISAHPGTPIL